MGHSKNYRGCSYYLLCPSLKMFWLQIYFENRDVEVLFYLNYLVYTVIVRTGPGKL